MGQSGAEDTRRRETRVEVGEHEGAPIPEGAGPVGGRYLQGVVGWQGPGPLHHWGGGAVQQLQRILHYGKGGKEKSPV